MSGLPVATADQVRRRARTLARRHRARRRTWGVVATGSPPPGAAPVAAEASGAPAVLMAPPW